MGLSTIRSPCEVLKNPTSVRARSAPFIPFIVSEVKVGGKSTYTFVFLLNFAVILSRPLRRADGVTAGKALRADCPGGSERRGPKKGYQGETVRTIWPFLKILIRPPDCETTIPSVFVTSVIPATDAWRDPRPAGIWTALVSTVM